MRTPTHYKRDTKECKSCGKRSKIRIEGRYLGFAMDITTATKDMYNCPKCGTEHKIAFGKTPDTFPVIRRGLWREIK